MNLQELYLMMKTMTIYKIAAGILMALSGFGGLSIIWAVAAAFVKLTGIASCTWLVVFAPMLLAVALISLLIMFIGMARMFEASRIARKNRHQPKP